jgi:hypothetical protein
MVGLPVVEAIVHHGVRRIPGFPCVGAVGGVGDGRPAARGVIDGPTMSPDPQADKDCEDAGPSRPGLPSHATVGHGTDCGEYAGLTKGAMLTGASKGCFVKEGHSAIAK